MYQRAKELSPDSHDRPGDPLSCRQCKARGEKEELGDRGRTWLERWVWGKELVDSGLQVVYQGISFAKSHHSAEGSPLQQ